MTRQQSLRRRLEELANEFEPALQRAFLAAIDDITSRAEIGRIVERLERGDINGALRALHLDPAAFRAFEEAIRQTYIGGGTAATDRLPQLRGPDGGLIVVRFDTRNPRAERFLESLAGTRITRMTDDMLQAARQHLTGGMAAGRNPRSVALDLVGRVSRASGRREGGIIGLTSAQERFVARAREELTSGDETLLRAFLGRKRRDRRFDRTILASIRDETPLPRATVDRILGRYSDRLLQLRGETVARTEALGALNASARDATEAMIDAGGLNRQHVRKIWRTARDERVRASHAELDGESVGIDEPFPNGLMYPCEPGGDPAEVINCRCMAEYRYDHLANLE